MALDKEYICLSCLETFSEYALYKCHKCGEFSCPSCGGEVSTIQEYDKAIKANE